MTRKLEKGAIILLLFVGVVTSLCAQVPEWAIGNWYCIEYEKSEGYGYYKETYYNQSEVYARIGNRTYYRDLLYEYLDHTDETVIFEHKSVDEYGKNIRSTVTVDKSKNHTNRIIINELGNFYFSLGGPRYINYVCDRK